MLWQKKKKRSVEQPRAKKNTTQMDEGKKKDNEGKKKIGGPKKRSEGKKNFGGQKEKIFFSGRQTLRIRLVVAAVVIVLVVF